MISVISALEMVVVPDTNILLQVAASVVDVAGVNPIGITKLLANGLSTFLTNCPILCSF